ncbi:PqqD family protein [Microbacterium sp. C7(2022)]|uniref:PqqD family protein n=1 Tax=Microbacterium sp. C7(2022) TaxID=2992759 RepID=UPI00237A6A53|nr:PqqD family protein [Microbacterium sp. C7(2022)]MDE0545355.1 PqqD family protein [Microbacterium sp. C7(2022)]
MIQGEDAAQWRIRDDVAWTGEGDRYVALALSDQTCTPRALEGSAALVWQALADGGGTAEQISERVAASAGVDESVVREDVGMFLSSLEEADLVACDATPTTHPSD